MIAALPEQPKGDHLGLSPTGCAVLLVIAFIFDWLAIGPPWLQIRLTFMAVVTAVRAGFDDSPLDKWTVDRLSEIIQGLLDQAKGAYIANAVPATLVGVLVMCLSIYTMGCMLPIKWSKRLGRISTAQFKETPFRKINGPVWLMAIPLGLLADLPADGWIASLTDFCVGIYAWCTAPLPALLFGAG